ncbi:MAG TPA: alpha/beta hydrolase [Chloroflexota bacterium]
MFLWTEFNPSIPTPTAQRAHEAVPGSRFLEMKNCAHWLQWEDPQAFNAAVRSFLLG